MYENKISARQLRRMIFIETFGAGALSIPALACYKKQSGFWSLIFYGVFLAGTVAFFIIFSEKIGEKNLEKRKINKKNLEERKLDGKRFPQLIKKPRLVNADIPDNKAERKRIEFADFIPERIKIVYIIRFLINASAIFYFFGKTIQTVYMPESSFLFIIFPAAILLWYSLYTTLQKRARFLEIIFPWIIMTYFIAVILSFIGIEKAMHIGNAGELWQGIFSDNIFRSMGNGYLILLCSSPIEFLLFLRPAAETRGTETRDKKAEDKNEKAEEQDNKDAKDNKTIRDIITAVAGAIVCNILFCFLSIRTLGPNLASQSEWPVIKMMQLIRMPGGFLERFDILPIIFWILCMMAVLSGYLYYAWSIFQSQISHSERELSQNQTSDSKGDFSQNQSGCFGKNRSSNTAKNNRINSNIVNDKQIENASKERYIHSLYTGSTVICLVLLAYAVEKNTFLWTLYLKYKAFVDFPLSLILPILVCFFKRQKDFNYQERTKEKIEEDKEERRNVAEYKEDEKIEENSVAKYKNTKQAKYSVGITLLIFFPVLFFLTGCQRLTDVEEKNYILSMYVDYPSDEEDAYEFWIAWANLSEMEEQSDEISCQITKIKARNLQELEEKYLETVPGKIEWNHIYTIFLGSGMAANKTACTRLLKQWDNEWQKSPNVLLALCLENPKKLYKIKNISAGAAGQEANLLAEQNKEKYSEQICETPIDYLRVRQQKEDKITLYRVTIENGNLKIRTDEL